MSDKLIDRLLVDKDYAGLKEDFINIIGKKIANRIEEKKSQVVAKFNGIFEAKNEEDQEDESDEHESKETEDEEENEHKNKKNKKSKKDDDDEELEEDVDKKKKKIGDSDD